MDKDDLERFEELDRRLKIDDMNLDAELIGHPHDYWHAARGTADAISMRDKAKEVHDAYCANLNMILRKELNNGKDRITESQLNMMVLSDPDKIKLYDRYLDYKHDADLWIGLRESFLQKGYAIKSLIEIIRSDQISASSYAQQRREAFANYRKPD